MAGVGLPHEAIREQLGRGLDLVIQLARLSDGSRRVVEVAEVARTAGGVGVRALFRLGSRRRTSLGAAALIALAALAGGLVAIAVREALLSAPRIASWLRAAVAP